MVNYETALHAVLSMLSQKKLRPGASIYVCVGFVMSSFQYKAGAASTFWHIPLLGLVQAKCSRL